MKCSIARRVIDEVDNPANLPYEAAGHLEGCGPCRQFAEERDQLRKLLLEPLRVSAPANFETMVARRLARRAGERRPFWLAGGFYLRAAGAAVALASLILVAQVTMLRRVPSPAVLPISDAARLNTLSIPAPEVTGGQKTGPDITPVTVTKAFSLIRSGKPRGALVKPPSNRFVTAAITEMTMQPRALLLVRNPGSEHEIAVPMVSVGAQPWLSISLHSQDERGIRAAF